MKAVYAVLSLALLAGIARADNFRCGKWIASTDLTPSELIAKCGQPASRETRVEDVWSRNARNSGTYKSGEKVIETWTYDRGTTAPPIIVTIVDGRIKSIERKQ